DRHERTRGLRTEGGAGPRRHRPETERRCGRHRVNGGRSPRPCHLSCSVMPAAADSSATGERIRVGYLGPPGTFTEQALLTQPDLASGALVELGSITDVIEATSNGEVDVGVVPLENAIEGAVNVTLDTLTFEADLLIQREIVISVQMNLLGLPGAP